MSKTILKLSEHVLFETLQKVVPHSSLANYHFWWIFTKCKASTNCYGNTPQSLPSCCLGLFTIVTRRGLVWRPNILWMVWCAPSSSDVYTESNALISPGTHCIVVATTQWLPREWITCSMHVLALKPWERDWYKVDCNPFRFGNCNRNRVWA